MRGISLVALILAAALVAGCDEVEIAPVGDAQAVSAAPASAPTTARATDSAFDASLNAFRAQNGLGTATWDPRLTAAAQKHAEDMQVNGYFDHRSRDGRSYVQRIAAEGYPTCWPVENIAWGQRNSEAAFASWVQSPDHRRNMLTSGNVRYGIGQAGNIFVLDLARSC